MLILDVINVLGVDKTLRLFYETVSIQENGGELTTDGTRRLAAAHCVCVSVLSVAVGRIQEECSSL